MKLYEIVMLCETGERWVQTQEARTPAEALGKYLRKRSAWCALLEGTNWKFKVRAL